MATSSAKTVTEYLESLPAARRAAIEAVRKVVRKNLPLATIGKLVAATSVDAFVARCEASRKRK